MLNLKQIEKIELKGIDMNIVFENEPKAKALMFKVWNTLDQADEKDFIHALQIAFLSGLYTGLKAVPAMLEEVRNVQPKI